MRYSPTNDETGNAVGQDVPRGIGSWPEGLGNHRVRVSVADRADAVWVHVPWRRRDAAPQDIGLVIVDASTGKPIRDIVPVKINREFGDIVFRPETAPGEYHIYYMPFTSKGGAYVFSVTYSSPEYTPDRDWLERNHLTPRQLTDGSWQSLPTARVLEVQARSEFDRFDPMEVIATAEETKRLLAQHPKRSYLLFPEDREHAIRMTDDLPLRWIQAGPSTAFKGEAARGEFFVLQIGVYAARKAVKGIEVRFSDLRSAQGATIPASEFRCLNLGGTDWLGRPIEKTVGVSKGKVQALWFGVQILKDADPGQYDGATTLSPTGAQETTVNLSLVVSSQILDDAGDGELWRLSRLRWLDSTVGLDEEVTPPYTALEVSGQSIRCLGREVRFADNGLLASIKSNGREILAETMAMVVETADGDLPFSEGKIEVLHTSPGVIVQESQSSGGDFTISCWSKMECDGYVNFRLRLQAQKAVEVKDIRLEIPFKHEIAVYMMGLGRKGGSRPQKWEWVWNVNNPNNQIWMGDADAGLHCKLKDAQDTWEILDLKNSGVPQSWDNNGKGGCTVTELLDKVLMRAYSGERSMQAQEEIEFRFGLLITPVKPLDPDHWNQRYYHVRPERPDSPTPLAGAFTSPANTVNIHHGTRLNPYINYPFLTTDELSAFVREAHENGKQVKIYYTVRELSSQVAEMWPLRSLGTEVFVDEAGGHISMLRELMVPNYEGPGGGSSWLREHLVSNYSPAWHHVYPSGEVDASIETSGLSRWHNYYLEGLAWLLSNVEIDGLYLDGIGYNREVMKRIRKIVDRTRPGCLIDFHSDNSFRYQDHRGNPAAMYAEHFPYINSLWFGEGYDYNNESPDYWLVEISGIPFGLFGDMLQDNGNPWRGMVYGMTARYFLGADPQYIWKLWDDFGIQEAKMVGYWSPACPVRSDHQDVLATAYCKKGSVLIALASWAGDPVSCRLQIDWESLGLDQQKVKLTAPAITDFQEAATFQPTSEIPVEPGRGWLLILG